MRKLIFLNGSGDESVLFTNTDNAEAAEKFAKAMAAGGAAFSLDEKGNSKRITEFDPNAEEVIIVGHYQGG